MSAEPITCCSECGDTFDVYRAPDERICDACLETSGLDDLLGAARGLLSRRDFWDSKTITEYGIPGEYDFLVEAVERLK